MAFGSASRAIKLYLNADSTNLERGLTRAEARLKRFERVAGKSSTINSGLLGGLGKGGAFTAGAGVAFLGLKRITDAAKESQVILGQTSVAVEDAGLSWAKYGDQVSKASLAIANSSAFDDEAVLQSFSVFIRGQKDVAKSLELAKLSADVARGRYTDLASATQLVNKAALGQIGALRRAGIQIDKNATSTQALTALQAAYGGAAVRYATSAAGAQDKLRVKVENLQESLGEGLLPVLTEVVDVMAAGVDAASVFGSALEKIGVKGKDVGNVLKAAFLATPAAIPFLGVAGLSKLKGGGDKGTPDVAGGAAAFSAQFGLGALTAAGTSGTNRKGFKVGPANGGVTDVSTALRNKELDARLSGKGLRGVLVEQAAELQKELRSSLPEEKVALKSALLAVTDEIKSIDQQIIDDAKDKKEAAREAKERLREANKKARDALKDLADTFKNAALDALGQKQDNLNTARQLHDAKENFALAKQLGAAGPNSNAFRALQDAQIARQRARLEQSTVTARGGTFTVSGGIHLHGIKNVKELLAALQQVNRGTAPTTRGRAPGNAIGLG